MGPIDEVRHVQRRGGSCRAVSDGAASPRCCGGRRDDLAGLNKLIDRLFDRLTALTAAFFVAVAFLHVRDSHFGVTDVPMTALVMAALVALSSAVQDPTRVRRWALSGALAGLAASNQYGGLRSPLAWRPRSSLGSRATRRNGPMYCAARSRLGRRRSDCVPLCMLYAILDAPHFLEGLQFDFNHLMEVTASCWDAGGGIT